LVREGNNLGQQPSATVIVCTRDRAASLQRCLEHIGRLDYPDFEVLVVDNGSTDKTAQIARDYHADYIYVAEAGLSRARNAGALHARTEIVAYIDDDAVPQQDWLSALAREFEDPRVMAVAGDYLPPGAAPLESNARKLVVDTSTQDWLPTTAFGGVGNGNCMAFRSAAFNVWPGFDERFGRGSIIPTAEEHLAFLTLCTLGFRCVYTPDAAVYHEHAVDAYETSVAYVLMLIREMPELRWALIRHLWRSLTQSSRPWRGHRRQLQVDDKPLTRWAKLRAGLRGVRLFLRAKQFPRAAKPLFTQRRVLETQQ
jgi:glycosyltransferase involved in cell wall biosynthesis